MPHGISQRRFKKIEDTEVDLMNFNDKFGLADKSLEFCIVIEIYVGKCLVMWYLHINIL